VWFLYSRGLLVAADQPCEVGAAVRTEVLWRRQICRPVKKKGTLSPNTTTTTTATVTITTTSAAAATTLSTTSTSTRVQNF